MEIRSFVSPFDALDIWICKENETLYHIGRVLLLRTERHNTKVKGNDFPKTWLHAYCYARLCQLILIHLRIL